MMQIGSIVNLWVARADKTVTPRLTINLDGFVLEDSIVAAQVKQSQQALTSPGVSGMETLAHIALFGLALVSGILVGALLGQLIERAIYHIKRRQNSKRLEV